MINVVKNQTYWLVESPKIIVLNNYQCIYFLNLSFFKSNVVGGADLEDVVGRGAAILNPTNMIHINRGNPTVQNFFGY